MRTFGDQEIADAFSTLIFDQPVNYNYKRLTLEEYIQKLQEPAVMKATPYEITNHITEGRPDIYNFYKLYNYIVLQASKVLIDPFPNRFAEILNRIP